MPKGTPSNRWSIWIFFLVWLLSAVYMGLNLKRSWIPHDEGILGQAAERVLQGEMPHRDFNDPYTGGLSYLDAAAFRLFGVNLLVLRYVLFAFFLAWVPAVYAAAREFSAPWSAAGITLLAVAWSVPNYPAAMPSWFCLFFATFGSLALLKYIRLPRTYLLVLAGLCGGFSFLVKSPGLYFVAGVLLFFVYREQSLSMESKPAPRRSTVYTVFVFLCLTILISALVKLVLPGGGLSDFLHFVVPEIVIVALLAFRERHQTFAESSTRFTLLLRMVTPFLCAVAFPITLFLALYWRSNAIGQLVNGLFVLHLQRLVHARVDPPYWIFALPSLCLALLLTRSAPRRDSRPFVSVLKILLAAIFLISCFYFRLGYLLVLHAFWSAIPVLTVGTAAVFCLRLKHNESTLPLDQQVMLLLSVTALCSLVQFPFAVPIYFCYFAPLTILTVALVLSCLPTPSRLNIQLTAVVSVLFAVFLFRPGFLGYMSHGYHPDDQIVPLTLPRAKGLRVSQHDADEYGELIPFVRNLATGRGVLAAPECPEVYFLAELKNPTGILFDFFHEPREYKALTQAILDRPDFIDVVVLCEAPEFSEQQLNVLRSLVPVRFPQSRRIGDFEVFWVTPGTRKNSELVPPVLVNEQRISQKITLR